MKQTRFVFQGRHLYQVLEGSLENLYVVISLRGNCFAREYLRRDWFSRAGPQGSNPLLRVHRVRGREVATAGGGVS